MNRTELFQTDPREYALEVYDIGWISAQDLIPSCLKAMSHQDVRDMLEANELAPRFLNVDYEDAHQYEELGSKIATLSLRQWNRIAHAEAA